MADIRCPMCGKMNSDEQETCQFCQARLKPLYMPPSSSDTQPFSASEGEAEENLPDWLNSLRANPSSEEGEARSFDFEGEDAENFDPAAWLAGMRGRTLDAADEPPQGALAWDSPLGDETPDWLSDLGSDNQPSPEETSPLPADFPDWLKREEETSGESSDASEAAARLDWLTGGEELPAESAPPPEEPLSEQGLPNWLTSPEPVSEPSEPDWLKAEPGQEETPEEAPAQAEDIPSWLAELEQKPLPSEEDEVKNAAAPFAAEEEDALLEDADWMADLPVSTAAASPSQWSSFLSGSDEPETEPQSNEADNLDWLNELSDTSTSAPVQEASATAAPFSYDEEEDQSALEPLYDEQPPDWLVEASNAAQEGESSSEKAVPFASGAILPFSEEESVPERGELPTWLEALRPVEAVAPEAPPPIEGEEQLEGVGPLAGLKGVLPAEPDIAQPKKPGSYNLKLQISETQAKHAEILTELIANEGVAQPLPARPRRTPQQLLRILIALGLILVAAWGVLTGTPRVGLPLFTPAAGTANRLMDELNSGAPVLVAFDYDPGFSGELNATASALLDHLMNKGAFLALVSTTPNGPVQAERLIGVVNQQGGHAYAASAQYVNLGFLAGGASGLNGFALDPRGMLPLALASEGVWAQAPLNTVTSLSDFDLVVVFTEDPERARNWIEQVQPGLGDTPLIMGVSAQVEPLVRPYLGPAPQQVQGLVSGLSGGASYENLTGRTGQAAASWSAFNLTVLMTVALIALGMLFNGLAALFGRSRGSEREDAR